MHDCPVCGEACYCGGDIEDHGGADPSAEESCEHCIDADDPDYEDELPRCRECDAMIGYGESHDSECSFA